jgi:hypothetical protein
MGMIDRAGQTWKLTTDRGWGILLVVRSVQMGGNAVYHHGELLDNVIVKHDHHGDRSSPWTEAAGAAWEDLPEYYERIA